MSWAEVFKINKNMKKALNEQLQDMKFQPVRIITATSTYKPEKTGLYKIICVGAGGNGYYTAVGSGSAHGSASGGGGGVAIKTMTLLSSTNYSVTIGTTASFAYSGGAISATAGGTPTAVGSHHSGVYQAAGGTASGGDYNFTGEKGSYTGGGVEYTTPKPGSVGVAISDLSKVAFRDAITLNERVISLPYGDSIWGYGGGASAIVSWSDGIDGRIGLGQPAAVIIVPIEMEE